MVAATSWAEAKDAGNSHYRDAKFQEAIESFTQAIKLDPSNASGQLHVFYSNRSAAHLASGNASAALKDAVQCLQANPSFVKGHSRRGAALFRLGRFQEATAAYEAGLALEPANAEMRKALAEAQKAAVDNRPLGMDELRPKLNAFLARNGLAARLALPRMLLVLATGLYLVPFFSRTFSSRCYRVALAAAFGSHFAAIYSRVGRPQFNMLYLQRAMLDSAAPYFFLCFLLFSFRAPYPLGLGAILLSEGMQLLWLFSECVAIARPATAKGLATQCAGLATRYTQNPRYGALSAPDKWKALSAATRGHCAALEIANGLWLILQLLTPSRNAVGIWMYYSYMQMRWMLDDPDGPVKQKVKELDARLLSLSQHPRCPGPVGTLYGVIRGYCQRAVQLPDPAAQQQAQQAQGPPGLAGLASRCSVM